MKEALLPIACLALLGGLVWFLVKQPTVHLNTESASNPASRSIGGKDEKSPAIKDGTKAVRSIRARASVHPEKADEQISSENVITAPAAPAADKPDRRLEPPFPAVSQLAPGLDRSHVLDWFGKPDLEATTVNRGALLETYLYRHKSDGRTVLVYMKDGRIERAGATP